MGKKESIDPFQAIFRSSVDSILIMEPDGTVVDLNEQAARRLGKAREEIIGSCIYDLLPSAVAAVRKTWMEKAFRNRTAIHFEDRREDIYFDHTIYPVSDSAGMVVKLIAVGRDITQQKQSEISLFESEKLLRTVIENIPVVLFALDAKGVFTLSEGRGLAALRLKPAEVVGKSVFDIYRNSPSVLGPVSRALDGEIFSAESKVGELVFEVSYHPVRNELHELIGTIGVAVDITERKKMEDSLRFGMQIVDSMEEGVNLVRADNLIIVYANKKLEEMLGYDPNELIGKHVSVLNADRDKTALKISEDISDALIEKHTWKGEVLNVRKDGSSFWSLASISGFHHGEYGASYLTVQTDITDLKKAEELLSSSEQRWRFLIDTSAAWIWETDSNLRHVYTNKFVTKCLGYLPEELIHQNSLQSIHPDDHPAVKKIIQDAREHKIGWSNQVLRWRHKDGSWRYIESSGTALFNEGGNFLGLHGVDHDITERIQSEKELNKYRNRLEELVTQRTAELSTLNDQLRQSQKLEAVGILAGGVAHEFSNILSIMKGSMYLIQKQLPEGGHVMKYVEQFLDSINKANILCQGLLTFSRKQTIILRPINFNKVIRNVGKMLKQLIREDITLSMKLSDRDPTVMADMNQIEQVLVNLVTNARDAMPDGGILTIGTDVVNMDEDYKKQHGYGVPGEYVVLTISDNGSGVEEAIREKIFEPFFTTKAVGKGSGLGLAVTYGIVKQHKGFIDVESAPAKGTTFKLYFPTVEAEVIRPIGQDRSLDMGGTETVLLAEDDEDVRATMSEVLMMSGYTVLEARDGKDALSVFMENKDRVQLVFLDVRMPKKNGRAVYEEIKRICPQTKFLFISGYTEDIIASLGVREGEINFISKAALPDDILRKIREALDQ